MAKFYVFYTSDMWSTIKMFISSLENNMPIQIMISIFLKVGGFKLGAENSISSAFSPIVR